MRIRFLGLAIHVRVGGSDFVVLPKHTDHEAVLRVPVMDIDGESDSDIRIRCFALSGKTLGFSLTGPVARKGLAGVPSLTAIGGGGGLDPHIATQTTGGDFDAFVRLAGGEYGVEDWFANHGTVSVVGLMCVPRTVVVDTRATAPVDVTGLATAFRLKPWATITITNIEKQGIPPATGQFGVYGNLFEPPAGGITMTPDASVCKHGTLLPDYPLCPNDLEQSFGVECSNSQYP